MCPILPEHILAFVLHRDEQPQPLFNTFRPPLYAIPSLVLPSTPPPPPPPLRYPLRTQVELYALRAKFLAKKVTRRPRSGLIPRLLDPEYSGDTTNRPITI